jgi:hypothetical protein
VGLPAAPDDPAPGTTESSQRAAVIVSPFAGLGVAVSSPGVPEPGGLGKDPERVAQSFIARPAEPGVLAFA